MNCQRCNRPLKNHTETGMGEICAKKIQTERSGATAVQIELVYNSGRGNRNYLIKTGGRKIFAAVHDKIARCHCALSDDCNHIRLIEAEDKKRFPEDYSNAVETAQKTVAQIFASRHVSTVEVGFEYEAGTVRYYSAITNDRGIPHRYRVRVEDSFETGERVTVARCNCPAKSTCRHIAAVAKEDAATSMREIYPNDIAKYRAHKHYRRAA